MKRFAVGWRAALALALLAAALVACAPTTDAPGSGTAHALQDALLIEPNGEQQRITLPDAWEASAPDRRGTVRYRLQLPDAALTHLRVALFVPRAGQTYSVELNGLPLRSVGLWPHLGGMRTNASAQEPLLLTLPAAMLRAHGNEVEIVVSGEPRRDAGLSRVWVGAQDELEAMHAALHRHQVRSAWVVSAAAAVMGTLALLLAWRARRFVYACFGAASLLWAWRMSGFELPPGSAWAPLGTVLFQASYAWFVVLMALYALAVVGRDGPRTRAVLGAWALLALALAVGMWVFNAPLLHTLLLGGTLAVVVWLLPVLLRTAWRERSHAALLLAGATLFSVAVGARDFWVFRVLHEYGAVTWSRYTILLLLVVLAWLLVDEFARSSAALRTLNRELLDRVAEKERELQTAFERRRDSERRDAVLAERDRILREMHDGLGGRLVAAMALTSQVERQSLPPPGGAPRSVDEPLRDLKLALDDCLVELRLALDSLETDQRPLIEALAELRFRVEPSLRAAGVRLVWQLDDAASAVELPATETLHVLRVVREALTNVIKHAQATVVWLRLETRPDGDLALAVVDNGLQQRRSEDADLELPMPVKGGRGLANMQRRAKALGARLESGPQEEGWGVTLVLARPAAEETATETAPPV